MIDIIRGKPLSELCTLGIGGPANYFTEARSLEDLQCAFQLCHQKGIPFFILGKGSNCLFDSQGFDGLVILNKLDHFEEIAAGIFKVGAGYHFSLLGRLTAKNGWEGLEFASGIPASVGGAVFMNAGANGSETCDHLISVDFLKDNGELIVLEKTKIDFSYRTSSFQNMKGAIVGATFALKHSESARKKQLEIINYRSKTQPLSAKSAGCIFRNPPGKHAGALIEQAGLKGTKMGGAQISDIHANFIVNTGEATTGNVLDLIEYIKTKVKDRMGVELESEVRVVVK